MYLVEASVIDVYTKNMRKITVGRCESNIISKWIVGIWEASGGRLWNIYGVRDEKQGAKQVIYTNSCVRFMHADEQKWQIKSYVILSSIRR